MSDELQILTTNAASDGWVDGVPGAVSTGYQAQNTALQALFNGVDKSSCSVSGSNLVIAAGGLIDDSGLPFVITDAITLALPTTGAANWFLRVVPGSTALERSIEFTDDRGTYNAAKNGFYDGDGYRVLNWSYNRLSAHLIQPQLQNDIALPTLLKIGESANNIYSISYVSPSYFPAKITVFGAVSIDAQGEFSAPTFTAKGNGVRNIGIQLRNISLPTVEAGELHIYKNGVSIMSSAVTESESGVYLTGKNGCFISEYLEDGDTIEFYVLVNGATFSCTVTNISIDGRGYQT